MREFLSVFALSRRVWLVLVGDWVVDFEVYILFDYSNVIDGLKFDCLVL